MLESHQDLETPESATSIWRYMGIDKLLHLLATSSLWFSRCDQFRDGWEGRYSDATYETFLKSFRGEDSQIKALWGQFSNINQQVRRCLYISCWHLNEEESAALWQIYSGSGKCVAVKSSVQRLRDALADTDLAVLAGRVKYCDYSTDPIPMGNLLTPFTRKRRSFAFENELRLLHWRTDLMSPNKGAATAQFLVGISVPIKLAALIERVYLSPGAEPYLRNSVRILLDKFDLNRVELQVSEFFSGPT